MGLKQADSKLRKNVQCKIHSRWVLFFACLLTCSSALGQEPATADESLELTQAEPVSILEELPESRHLAASLADPSSRMDTLLTSVAVARLLDYAFSVNANQVDELEARFRDERSWLDRLATRYPALVLRSSILDPSAWYLQQQLNQQELEPDSGSAPLGPDSLEMMHQLFDQSDERLAAALLPEILHRVEPQTTTLWEELRFTVSVDDNMAGLVLRLHPDWFDPWLAAEPPAPTAEDASATLADSGADQLKAIAFGAINTGPPDDMLVTRLRFRLLTGLPAMGFEEARDAEHLLVLASAVDGLKDGKYLAFTESLLWVSAKLLLAAEPYAMSAAEEAEIIELVELLPRPSTGEVEASPEDPVAMEAQSNATDATLVESQLEEPLFDMPYVSPLPQALSELLPLISNAYSADFAEVDSRINANLAAVFDVIQYLRNPALEQQRLMGFRAEIADAIAQFVLQVPDMSYYFDQPVRQQISEEIDGCISLVANSQTLSREAYDNCLESLVDMAGDLVRRAELAGDPDGPFGPEQLRRELMLAPWQRINYALGYLHDRFPTDCGMPDDPLPNPIEWANLASTFTWFARQSPVYFKTPENEALLSGLLQQGASLRELMMQQVDCIGSSGNGTSDPVIKGLQDYRESLDSMIAGLREAELEFRASVLKPGADVVLHGDATQSTAYRPEALTIGPCDPDRVCEMTSGLEATRALMGQFPDSFLIADQIGLGEIEICYDNTQWVERRSEPVRADDPHVANYYGRLSFELVGRYHEKEETRDVFGFRFVSPQEYHYMFAAASQEVLDDSCPTEWVGSRIVTEMNTDAPIRVVPNRLTYLAASRNNPSELVNRNWSRNEEWRDSFMTGKNVTAMDYPRDNAIEERINRQLKDIYQAEQSALYAALLNPPMRGRGNQDSLFELTEDLNARKALLRSYINLFYPRLILDSDEIRSSLQGYSALLDRPVLRRFRGSNIAVSDINEAGIARLERLQAHWNRQPEVLRRSGTVATGVAHAITRLDALFEEYFVIQPGPGIKAENTSSMIDPNG